MHQEDVSNVNRALKNESFAEYLCTIQSQYSCLPHLITKFECQSFTIDETFQTLEWINFGRDSCSLKEYISSRLQAYEISSIVSMSNQDINPATYGLLTKCQPTTCIIRRRFSVLGKLLEKDWNLKIENVKKYSIF